MDGVVESSDRMSYLVGGLLVVQAPVYRIVTAHTRNCHKFGAVCEIIALRVKNDVRKLGLKIMQCGLEQIIKDTKVCVIGEVIIREVRHYIADTVCQQMTRQRHGVLRIHEAEAREQTLVPLPKLLVRLLIEDDR